MIFMVLLIAEWGLHAHIQQYYESIFNPYLKFFNFLIFGKVF